MPYQPTDFDYLNAAPLVQAAAPVYRASQGEHPAFWAEVFGKLSPFIDLTTLHAWRSYGFPAGMCSNGHSVMVLDDGQEVALSPLFVKDLSGRIIHTGLGAEVKEVGAWAHTPYATFPKRCWDVTAAVTGAGRIEQVFFTLFRALDVSAQPDFVVSGMEEPVRRTYAARNLYPYKLRLDTFYADGWRLPQTQMLYARPVEDAAAAQALADKFMQRWENRPKGQDYPAFYEANDGDTLLEQLFGQGVSVIPTFEACNGYNKVSADFELEDFWPGRAVQGLHEIAEVRADSAPKGTILEVKKPGYVTATAMSPAEVVVSDGSGYVTPHGKDDAPLAPDLRLPHQRTRARWGQTWLPTQPSHFEAPALWGWDADTGRFLQLSGPIWDPLHYYYASVPQVLKAMRRVTVGEPCPVPAAMQRRFYPAVPMEQYDTLSLPTLEARLSANLPLVSAVDHVTRPKACGVGYHPLPLMYEYELDTFMFPELAPAYRLQGKAPPAKELAPVIHSRVKPEEAQKMTVVTMDSLFLKDESHFKVGMGEALTDYPQLERYVGTEAAGEEQWAQVPLWVAHVPEMELQRNIRRAVGGKKQQEQMEEWQEGLFKGYYDFREKALWWRRLRHRLFRKYPGWYVRGWWGLEFPENSISEGRQSPKLGAVEVKQHLQALNN